MACIVAVLALMVGILVIAFKVSEPKRTILKNIRRTTSLKEIPKKVPTAPPRKREPIREIRHSYDSYRDRDSRKPYSDTFVYDTWTNNAYDFSASNDAADSCGGDSGSCDCSD